MGGLINAMVPCCSTSGSASVAAADITDATAAGVSMITAVNAAAQRALLSVPSISSTPTSTQMAEWDSSTSVKASSVAGSTGSFFRMGGLNVATLFVRGVNWGATLGGDPAENFSDVVFIGNQAYPKVVGGNSTVFGWSANATGTTAIGSSVDAGFYRIGTDAIGAGYGASPTVTCSLSVATLSTKSYTVGTLPSGVVATRAFVSDETTGVSHATAVGGGSLDRPVYYGNGQWRVGG